MEKHYRFAGVELTVSIPEKWMYQEDRQLAPFRVSDVREAHVFRFEAVDALLPPQGEEQVCLPAFRMYREGERTVRYFGSVQEDWQNGYIRAEHRDKQHFVQVKMHDLAGTIGTKMILTALSAEHLIASVGGFVFHCSYIAWNGKAILFTAPSGAGKSTQAELWRAHRGARIINGDRAAVRLAGETLLAEGIPFAGSSQYCENSSLPVAAIVYLSQAPETTIRRLRGVGAFARIWEGISVNTWDNEDMERVSRMAQRAAGEIPVYHLACTPDETAVLALEQELRKLGRS